jgi:hypothetical protein
MMATHGVHVGANTVRNKRRVRGYPHVALTQPAAAAEPEGGEQAPTDDGGEETQGEF